MLRAGFSGTDQVTTVVAPRWRIKRILAGLMDRREPDRVGVHLLKPWDAEQIGKLTVPTVIPRPLLDGAVYSALEEDVVRVKSGDRVRTSALLHGPPGNGKSFLGRYLALKYNLPIYVVAFRPDNSNHDLIRMFSYVKGPCIVLMEDFDGYFHGRECQLNEAQFTFDAVLNVLDGTYASMDGAVVLMTVNDLGRVDKALKKRPGRLRHVIEIGVPNAATRARVFEGYRTNGLDIPEDASLDQLLALRESLPIVHLAGDSDRCIDAASNG